MFQAHDVIAQKVFAKPEYQLSQPSEQPTNGKRVPVEGPDPAGVTRVRLVQFMRRNAEPLVSR